MLLIAGGNLFFGSLFDLHRVLSGKPEVLHFDGSFNEQKETLLRAQVELGNVLAQTKPVSYSLHAVMELALALIRAGKRVHHANIPSAHGHDSFLLGSPMMNSFIHAFLDG